MVYKTPHSQRGVALIMAVVAVGIIAIIAVSMSSEQNLLVRRIQNIVLVDAAWQYAIGGEQFAALALKKDHEQGKKIKEEYDYPKEPHLAETFLFPIEDVGGTIEGGLEDLQGRFNLTNLQTADGGVDMEAEPAFKRLLTALGLNPNLAMVVSDWIDSDDQALPSGAEDSFYQTLERPYLAANQPFASLEELRLLKGFDELIEQPDGTQKTVFAILREHVAVLPTHTALNVNAASAPVLRAYMEHVSAEDAEAISAKGHGEEPYTSIDDFKQDEAHKLPDNRAVNWSHIPEIGVQSEYFAVNLKVSLGGIETPLYSVLHRNLGDGSVHIVRRRRGKQ